MSNAERIVKILREHRFERHSVSEAGRFEWWGHCKGCGFESDRRTFNHVEWELNMRDDEARHVATILDMYLDVELARLRGLRGWCTPGARQQRSALMKPSDVAAEAVVWGLVESAAKARKDEARAQLHSIMGPDVAAVKAVANGETIGRATWVEPKPGLAVVDAAAFAQYIQDKHPTELIVTVNPAFQKALLIGLKVVGDFAIDKDGEPVPGVQPHTSAPFVSVRKEQAARETVDALLSAGRLGLDGITKELEASDEGA